MKLRFPPQLKADLQARADLLKTTNQSVVYRSIKRWNGRTPRVALAPLKEKATRENSVPASFDLHEFEGRVLHSNVLMIVRWALDDRPLGVG